jgi:hypothetical protein
VRDNARDAHVPGRIDAADGDALPAASAASASAAAASADDDDLPERRGRCGWNALPGSAAAAAAAAGARGRTGLSLGIAGG